MKKRLIAMAVLAAVIIACAAVQPVMAYFTAYTTAEGTVTIALGPKTEIEEPEFEDWTKHVVITNNEEGNVDCWVRARAYAGGDLELEYSGEGWTKDGDWYVYDTILKPGESAEELLIEIGNIPAGAVEGDSFNVAVVYESVQVLYNADGTAQDADWSLAPSQITVVEGGQG